MKFENNTYGGLIEQKVKKLGFDACGFTPASELFEDKVYLQKWLNEGMHADMHYMENHLEKRCDATKLVDGAKTVIVLLSNYYPAEVQDGKYVISKYAYGEDYHFVIKDKLKELFDYIKADLYPQLEGRMFVDSAPVLERSLAVRAGLGWIGKNSNLINKELGSFVFISELIVNLEIPSGKEINNACGNCSRCIDACPTKAILSPRVVDARKCISYLTIENKGDIPEEFSGLLQNRIYGCDICQDVCPWNNKVVPHKEERFLPKTNFLKLTEEEWDGLTQEQFSELFKKSAIKRAKFRGLKRNIDFML
ncbi:tRNA epoxyqueuosine(34) reductase QueG [Plebeiibacterium marinum]|uniref:tRNA epoxyqueuosine(34) reductase QueG n=1 Tax=Plebeiibacterium marinum TaxID=2992111 RepID=A0AAE3SK48_9BACT|nr:tRNA epoxyqueuosine(34) reductase QueG [Plebeiobacterium marinum]MCW3805060.1 tRNA epoxyqueuosine(34) reductase QueG [Plebeiobacterium marinum]